MLDKADGSLKEELEGYSELFSGEPKPLSSGDPLAEKYLSKVRDKAMHSLGVGTTRDMDSVISDIFLPSLRMTEFTPTERINIWRGKVFTDKCFKDKFSFTAAGAAVLHIRRQVRPHDRLRPSKGVFQLRKRGYKGVLHL